jgi:hypothetical protein
VRDAIARLNLTEPCALDNDYRVSHRGQNLPAYFLFESRRQAPRLRNRCERTDQIEDDLDQLLVELRANNPFCATCELFLNKNAMFCADCGSPLTLPGPGAHPYYEAISSLPCPRFNSSTPIHASDIRSTVSMSFSPSWAKAA